MSACEQERDFDQLPEALRLALLDRARRELDADVCLSAGQIADASATAPATISRTLAVAMLKLRRRAAEIDLHP